MGPAWKSRSSLSVTLYWFVRIMDPTYSGAINIFSRTRYTDPSLRHHLGFVSHATSFSPFRGSVAFFRHFPSHDAGPSTPPFAKKLAVGSVHAFTRWHSHISRGSRRLCFMGENWIKLRLSLVIQMPNYIMDQVLSYIIVW